jgi:hypothetical protein
MVAGGSPHLDNRTTKNPRVLKIFWQGKLARAGWNKGRAVLRQALRGARLAIPWLRFRPEAGLHSEPPQD